MIQVIETLETLVPYAEVWRKLYCEARATVFQSFEYHLEAWKCLLSKIPENRLAIILAGRGDKDTVKLICPFYIDQSGALRFINDTHTDYNDVICRAGENIYILMKEVFDWISANNKIKRVHFAKMQHHSLLLHYGRNFLQSGFVYADNAFSYLTVQCSNDPIGEMSHMTTKDRSVLKSLLRKVSGYSFDIHTVKNGGFPIKKVQEMRDKMVQRGLRKLSFFPDDLIDFVERMFESDYLEVGILKNKEGVAEVITFRFRDERVSNRHIAWIFMSSDPKLVSAVDIRYIVDKAKNGSTVFDFGVGAYTYKLGNFKPIVESTFALVDGKNWYSLCAALFGMNVVLAKRIIRSKVLGVKK